MFIVGTDIPQGRHGEYGLLAFSILLNHLPDLSLRCHPAGDANTIGSISFIATIECCPDVTRR